MASTYTTGFGIEKIGDGEQAGAWGTTTNHNLDIIDRIASYKAVGLSGTTHTLTIREASPGSGTENLQDGMYRVIKFTGALGGNNTVTIAPNTSPAWFIIENATTDSGSSGPYSVILTQGSGANITVLNGKNAAVYCDGAGSGAAIYDAFADLQVATLDASGDITGSTLNADGDTAAGDAAAIGYTSAEGLILTGQGSTNDVTIKNDADADVITIATGATNVDVVGDLTAGTLNADGDTSAGDNATIGYTSAEGLILTGQGSTNDVTIKNDADADVITIATGTTNVDVVGSLTGGTLVSDGDATIGDDLSLTSDSAVINFGADSEVKVVHVADTGLNLKHTATADDKPIVLTLQTGETDIAADDVLGKLAFQAPDEAAGTDANLVAAAVQAVSEGDFSSSNNATTLQFMTGASEAATAKMYIKSDGKVGVGTASPAELFHIYSTANDQILKMEATGGNAIIDIVGNRTGNGDIGHLRWYNNGGSDHLAQLRCERESANNSGTLKVQVSNAGTMNDIMQFTYDQQIYTTQENSNTHSLVVRNSHSSTPICQDNFFNGAAPDDTTQYFLRCRDTSATRMYIMSNGNLQNHDNSYGGISDERIKETITDASSQWADLKAMRVVNYKRKDDVRAYGSDAKPLIGLVAQELESVSPGLVTSIPPGPNDILSDSVFGTLYKDGDVIPEGSAIGDIKEVKEQVKAVNYSVLYMKAIKALQEAMARIETLEAKVAALEA